MKSPTLKRYREKYKLWSDKFEKATEKPILIIAVIIFWWVFLILTFIEWCQNDLSFIETARTII